MRSRLSAVAVGLVVVAAACGDTAPTETADPPDSTTVAPTTTGIASSTTVSSTTTVPATSTVPSTTTTEPPPEGGMCGDWIPVVTEFGTTCVDPVTLPPAPVAIGTPWTLPSVDPSVIGDRWWHPPLALLNQDSVTLYEVTGEFDAPAITPWAAFDQWSTEIRVASDGSIVVARTDPTADEEYWPEVAVHRPDGTTDVIGPAAFLYDVAPVGGVESVIVADAPNGFDGTPLTALDLADPSVTVAELGSATESEYGVTHVDVVDDLVVVTAWSDLTEAVDYRDGTGNDIALPSPTDGLGYNQPPFVTAATLSPDGQRVTWAEGPDWDGAADGVIPAPWMVWSMDLQTGERVLGWPVTEELVDSQALLVHSVHDLGDHIIVNLVSWRLEGWWPEQAVVISLGYEEPESYRLPIVGIATPVPFTTG